MVPTHRLTEYASALVVIFTCNHCPYAIGSEDRIMALHDDYAARGVRLVAISSKETIGHPTDSFEHMVTRAKEKNFPFDYLFDEWKDQDAHWMPPEACDLI